MIHQNAYIDPAAATPERSAAVRTVSVAGALLVMLAALIAVTGPSVTDAAVAGLGLINGPLLEGPLIDLGGALSENQLGQFQQ